MSASLQGRRILVTRPAAQAGALAAMIAAEGGEALCFPLLQIDPIDDLGPLYEAAAHLGDYAIVVFISPNAVEYGLPTVLATGAWPAAVRAAAIGQSTVAALSARGVRDVIAPTERFDSEALLELPAFRLEEMTGKRVLILRGNGGRELLSETLRERGAGVDCVACYRRSSPPDASMLLSLLRDNRIDALTISSSEGLRNLWGLLDSEGQSCLLRLPLIVPHRRIAEQAAELGLQRVVLTAPADAGILDGLKAFEWL